jgi:SAM-dependent methyltransferase
MRVLREPNDYEWQRLHQRLDTAIADSARIYLQRLAVRHVHISARKLSDELQELRLGREPDYKLPGLPLIYALKYMPRRVISVYGSLLSLVGDWYPRSVLDIGSGTGATALALDLLNLPRHTHLLGIEPSQEMIEFAESSPYRYRVSSRYVQGSMADLAEGVLSLDRFDLIVFSTCLPYHFDDWDPLMTTIGKYQGQETKRILVIEPDAKEDLLTSFRLRLMARGWPTAVLCCHDLPEVIKQDGLTLPEMTDVWQRLGLEGAPSTWWNPPDDKFLIANPEPAVLSGSTDVDLAQMRAAIIA